MITKDFLKFFSELSQNNNRAWYHDNKKQYQSAVKKPFEDLITAVIKAVQAHDPEVQITYKEAVFRLYRDTRFSKDKTPYKVHTSGVVSKGGRKDQTNIGLYIQASHGSFVLGGGKYFATTQEVYKIRQYIQKNLKEFEAIINHKDFKSKYGTLKGEQHKRIPKEFKETHKIQPLIANKQFYYMAELPPETILKDDIIEYIISYYLAAQPLAKFLKKAMEV